MPNPKPILHGADHKGRPATGDTGQARADPAVLNIDSTLNVGDDQGVHSYAANADDVLTADGLGGSFWTPASDGGGDAERRFVYAQHSPLTVPTSPGYVDFTTGAQTETITNDAPLDAGYTTAAGTAHSTGTTWTGDYFRFTGDTQTAFDIKQDAGIYLIHVGLFFGVDSGSPYKLTLDISLPASPARTIEGGTTSKAWADMSDADMNFSQFQFMTLARDGAGWDAIKLQLSQDSGGTAAVATGYFVRIACVRLSPP